MATATVDRQAPARSPGGWTAADIPDLSGRTAVVTGASSGLGLLLTGHLAEHGATVLMAVRDQPKGDRVRAELLAAHPRGSLEVWPLDVADLDSVRRFATTLHEDGRAIDLLVNNAGIYNAPRQLTAQGHESQFATNFLGHFALTGLMLDLLLRGREPRLVSVGSYVYRLPKRTINFDDLSGERRYSAFGAYVQSKLATILFGLELDRRLRSAGSPLRSLVAHPGMASTPMNQNPNSIPERLLKTVMTLLWGRPAEQGVLPILYAATAPEAPTGVLIGPTGPKQHARIAFEDFAGAATDTRLATRLWSVSESLTGVRYLEP